MIIVIRRNKKKKKKQLEEKQQKILEEKRMEEYRSQLEEVKRQAEAVGDYKTIVDIKNKAYHGPLPNRKEDGTYTKIYANYVSYDIAGINHRKGICVGKFKGYLIPEPNNKFDRNAIAIYDNLSMHVGYIPSYDTNEVRSLGKDFPIEVYGEINSNEDPDTGRAYYYGNVLIEVSDEVRNKMQKSETCENK